MFHNELKKFAQSLCFAKLYFASLKPNSCYLMHSYRFLGDTINNIKSESLKKKWDKNLQKNLFRGAASGPHTLDHKLIDETMDIYRYFHIGGLFSSHISVQISLMQTLCLTIMKLISEQLKKQTKIWKKLSSIQRACLIDEIKSRKKYDDLKKDDQYCYIL